MSIGSRPIGLLPIAADEPVASTPGAYSIVAGADSYALTGTAAGLKHGWVVAAAVGSYAMTGAAAAIKHGYKVPAAAGSYTLTGSAAALKHGWKVAAGVGSYAFLGSDAALVYTPAAAGAGSAPYGYGGSVHRQGDTRWDGVREAREEARALFDEVAATTPAKRKDAAARASDAVAKVARTINPPVPLSQPLETGQWDSLLEDLEQLQAYLAGLAEQDRIKAAQAREAADRWALIEREMALEAAQEEELMVVLAMAL